MKNSSLQERKADSFARGQGNIYPIFVEQAKGSEVWDVEGSRYIDFGTGIAVCNTGHSHPEVVNAVKSQIDKFSHTCVMINPYRVAVELAEKLNAIAPGSDQKKTIFVSTGAEAVENGIKIARAYTGRRGVIAFNGGFHGRTNLAMGLTGKITPYKDDFGPFPGDLYHAPYPNELHGVSTKDSLWAIEQLFKATISPLDVAAIIFEPVQGEGGFYQAPIEFMLALRKVCDKHGIVLIADEVQTGFGRTGKMFCCEYAEFQPDLITMAKGIAGGFPIAAVVGKSEVMDAPLPGGLGGTYGGSPIGCAAALAVLQVIEKENLLQRSKVIGEQFSSRLMELKLLYPHVISDVRHLGAMVAMELCHDGEPAKPNIELTKAIIGKAAKYRLVLLACGYHGNVIRFLPALNISDEILKEGIDAFERLFRELM